MYCIYCIFPIDTIDYVNTYWSLERGHEHFGPARAIAHPEHGIRGAHPAISSFQSDASVVFHQTHQMNQLGISCIPVVLTPFFWCPRCPPCPRHSIGRWHHQVMAAEPIPPEIGIVDLNTVVYVDWDNTPCCSAWDGNFDRNFGEMWCDWHGEARIFEDPLCALPRHPTSCVGCSE